MGISKLNPSAGGIPYGNTAGRPANPGVGRLYSNGELQRLELYTGATYGWQNIVAETPGVTGYTGNVLESNSTNTITIIGTNFASGANATLVGTDGTEYLASNTTVNNLTNITATFGAIPADKEPYDIRVTNPSNLYGVYYDVLSVNDKPVWFTSAGSLGTFVSAQSVSLTVNATDEENNTITYSSSNLPAWLSLNSSTGALTGTTPTNSTNQTYSFTINASDGINTAVSRSFNVTVNAIPIITGGTLTSDSTYYYRTFTANGDLIVSNLSLSTNYLVVAGGGGAGGSGGANSGTGGGGAGGYLSGTTTLSPSTYSIVVGGGGSGGPAKDSAGLNILEATKGIDSQFASIATATGGGASPNSNAVYNGSLRNGGSGSGGTGNGNSGTGFPGTGISGQGNNGGTSAYGQNGSFYSGGGGGGAGEVGGNASLNNTNAGNGGVGLQWVNGTFYAGGGGGGTYNSSSFSSGGNGGGGNGGGNGNTPGGNGTANTGGGGGGVAGTAGSGTAQPGGNGGAGIVIVRYTKASVGG